jgi:GT2 family glycosyltransferase
MKILICIPTAGSVPVEFIQSIDNLRPNKEHVVARVYIPRSIIHIARENAVLEMIKGGYDALLYIDDDMTFDPDLVDRLVALNAPVASAACYKRVPPYTPCFYESLVMDDKGIKMTPYTDVPKDVFEAEGAGAACMLVRKEVFEKLQRPYFMPLPFAGEDVIFCCKLKTAGIKVKIDPSIRVGHLETRPIFQEHYEQWRSKK